MTTSTLELVDWATILADEPACEDYDEATDRQCEAAAEFVIVPRCGCDSFLACELHAGETAGWISAQLPILNLPCVTCGAPVLAFRVSDAVRMVPL